MEQRRITHANETPLAIKQELGQYFTPGHIADFMASLFSRATGNVRLLDPGAGIGSLSCAFAERIATEKWDVDSISVDAYEIDQAIVGQLRKNLTGCFNDKDCHVNVVNDDFLSATARAVSNGENPVYTHVIMNPPCEESVANNGLDAMRTPLKDVGVQVSTGAVVDFRTRDELRMDYEDGAAPLLYPVHFKDGRVRWPVKSKRPNAIMRTDATVKLLLPRGYYVVVKRFSAKEEKRRHGLTESFVFSVDTRRSMQPICATCRILHPISWPIWDGCLRRNANGRRKSLTR